MEFTAAGLVGPEGEPAAWPLLAVLGDPIAHSLSPRLHRAALAARSIDGAYEAIRVPAERLNAALGAARTAGVRGLNLTLPLKELALACVPGHTDECAQIGAANTLVLRDGRWMAHNTDARGLAMALERSLGRRLPASLRRCLILGAGGAARAAAFALQGLGARAIVVAARRPDHAHWATGRGASVVAWDEMELDRMTLVINCTPLGLAPSDEPPVDPSQIPADAHLVDLTYGAQTSRLLHGFAGSSPDGSSQDGRPMLVAQAALAFSVWFGALPPLREMAAAIDIDW